MRQTNDKVKNLFSHWETFLILIFLLVNVININLSPYYLNYNNVKIGRASCRERV